jgi:general secretion pathway protein B
LFRVRQFVANHASCQSKLGLNTPYLRQLPVEVQRVLPALNFSVHIYSDTPAARMVKLEDRVLREGQRVAPELDVVAIIPRAVVLRYRDQPFKVPAL